MKTVRVNVEPVPPQDTRGVYVAGLDTPIFFPKACIQANCPALGSSYAVDSAAPIMDIARPGQDQPQLAEHRDVDRYTAETAHYMTDELAKTAVSGECELALAFSGCWRREETDFNLFDLLKSAVSRS